jgi:predicted extracellular nuclease
VYEVKGKQGLIYFFRILLIASLVFLVIGAINSIKSPQALDVSISETPIGQGVAGNDELPTESTATVTPGNDVEFSCGNPYLPIYDIQGSAFASPYKGDSVTTEGIVTGDFQAGSQLGGFFMQDPNGDNDTSTSDGVFVFAGAGDQGILDVNVGDRIRLEGMVKEFSGLTEITDVNQMKLCSQGESIAPIDVVLPVSTRNIWEQYEGMLLNFPQTLTVTENYNLGRYGEVLLSSGSRLFVPTNGQGGTEDENKLREILLDDGNTHQNPETVPYLEGDGTLRVGDTVAGFTGILDQISGLYMVEPTGPVEFSPTNTRPAVPADVGGAIKIASFNVLNYFTDLDCSSCRGANDETEFIRQKDKIVNAILGLDADIVALMEIENNGDTAVADLVDGLNAASAPGTYDYISDPVDPFGTDAIKVAIIYQPGTVTPVGEPMTDISDGADIFERPPLAQTFEFNGEKITVVTNHFRSKSCSGALGEDLDNGQGCHNHKRVLQAEQLLNFIAYVEEESGDPDVLVLGDLNSYGAEDPINTLTDGGLVNEIAAHVPVESRYTYIFNGESGYLDHALSTPSLDKRISGVYLWHINADEPRILDYNLEYNPEGLYSPDPYKSSDHDPILVGICATTCQP